jgi:hypothetical protein
MVMKGTVLARGSKRVLAGGEETGAAVAPYVRIGAAIGGSLLTRESKNAAET